MNWPWAITYMWTTTRDDPFPAAAGDGGAASFPTKLEGDVLETYPEENAILIYTEEGGEYRVNLPETWAETGFEAQRAIVYYDGAATLSIPRRYRRG